MKKFLSPQRKEELIAFLNRLASEQSMPVTKHTFVNIDKIGNKPHTNWGNGKVTETTKGY